MLKICNQFLRILYSNYVNYKLTLLVVSIKLSFHLRFWKTSSDMTFNKLGGVRLVDITHL